MARTIQIVIGGKKYSLRGDNEALIDHVAGIVNDELDYLDSKHTKESPETLSVLAALNIAERHYKNQYQKEIDQKYVVSELKNMADFITNNLNK
jgi:cell division protein ZapA (FtsZ GTPase activity inhibitor)